jgi:uncharacterized protein YyaL (SSP411 family)
MVALLAVGCASRPRPPVQAPTSAPSPAAAPGADAAGEPSGAPGAPLAWAALDAATFARARAERRYLVVDGSAEWCHWCHVMEATTYHDPEVRRLLDERFVAVKVDVDTRPDFEETYREWGWPATVLLSPDGEELGKVKGYVPPDRFAELLRGVLDAPPRPAAAASLPSSGGSPAVSTAAPDLDALEAAAARQLDGLWDAKQGSWGDWQKVPLYWDNAWSLSRAESGDAEARRRALLTLDRQRAIIDPVWGGICQYSTDGDWQHPHFEKLLVYQAGAIDNYAEAYALTGDPSWLETARKVRGFVDAFLTSPDGGFFTSMDADLNAHDPAHPYVTGHDYYARGDVERRALGVPRVDAHVYARDSGLAIAAYARLGDAARDAAALATAERAAGRVLSTHATERGGIAHGNGGDARVLFLADSASFGWGLLRLHEATGKPEYLQAARKIADFMALDLQDVERGGFFAATPDPGAVGVFAARRKPFEDNVMAARFLARLGRLTGAPAYRAAATRAIGAVASGPALEERGRMIGDLLLALDELRR